MLKEVLSYKIAGKEIREILLIIGLGMVEILIAFVISRLVNMPELVILLGSIFMWIGKIIKKEIEENL